MAFRKYAEIGDVLVAFDLNYESKPFLEDPAQPAPTLLHEETNLWSHKGIKHSKDLGGVPDYLITRQSKCGKVALDKPLLAVVEAKKDDLQGGWAQCAMEMYAMQQINGKPETPIFGTVSNGDQWEFARLQGQVLTQMPLSLPVMPLDQVYAMLCTHGTLCSTRSQN